MLALTADHIPPFFEPDFMRGSMPLHNPRLDRYSKLSSCLREWTKFDSEIDLEDIYLLIVTVC